MATFGRSVAGAVLRPAMGTEEVADAYRAYARPVLRRCRRILRQQHAAEDVVQEVFLRLWRYGDSFREAECKLGWLYRVADRCCYNELRRRNGRRELPATDEPGSTPESHVPEDREVIRQFLGRFDERVQKVAVLHYVDEMTHDEIAALTGWSRQTIHKKLQCLRERAAALRGRLFGERKGD
jgi:RNA polymerase sigma-70 factor, ECF subfamily